MESDSGEVLFDIRHVSHTFETEEGKTFDALKDVTAQIKKGEFTAIIGTNGSGKSTLARHLNALLIPTEGELIVEGMRTSDADRVWDIRQKVGMVFQNPDNQLVAAVVEEDVAFGPENLGVPPEEIRERVDLALEKVGMTSYRKQAPSMLSGGQKQRVAIAGVLAMKPDCIVLDEPTAMLDPKGRKEVMDTIHELNKKEGITIVLITHFMEEAVTADHILVIDKGVLKMEGTPREIFSQADKVTEIGLDVPVPADIYGKGTPFERAAIEDIDLTIDKGEFIGIIGHTGSGKSTLIQHLNGLLHPSMGKVTVDGVDLAEKTKEAMVKRHSVGMVFQYPEHQLFEETVAKDIAFGPQNQGCDEEETEKRVKSAMRFAGIDYETFAERSPFRLSGGQQRRVAIAGVIAMHPDFLILDEPSAGLDPVGRREIFSRIQGWYKKGVFSVILVSHNMDDIARLATRLLVMHQGRLVLDGDPMDIFLHHRETLKECGVDAPPLTQTLLYLKEKGIPVPETARTVEEAAEKMYAVLGGGK